MNMNASMNRAWELVHISNKLSSIKSPVLRLFNPSEKNSTSVSVSDYLASSLNHCKDIISLKKLHACILTSGRKNDTLLGSKLIIRYADFGLVDESRWVFDEIIKPDLSIWNSVFVGYFRIGYFNEVLWRYIHLRQSNFGLDSSAVTFTLKSCIESGNFESAKGVHSDCFKFGLNMNPFVGSTLIGLYSKYGDINDAYKAFDEITERDLVVYTSMISGCSQSVDHCVYQAFNILRNMQKEELEPNRVSLVSLLQIVGGFCALNEGRSIHGYSIRRGIGCFDEIFETSLMDMYIKCKDLRAASCLFEKMSEKDIGSWNAVIAGYLQVGKPLEALNFFRLMVKENVVPDLITLANVILCFANLKLLCEGKAIHGYLTRNEIRLDLVAMTALIDMYSKCKSLDYTRKLFDGMEEKDVTTYNVMMTGCLKNESAHDVLEVFTNMVRTSMEPNVGSVLIVLSALSCLRDTKRGKSIHGYVLRYGFHQNTEIANQIIDMYAKCGCIHYAREVFNRIRYKNLVSWTSMTMGYAYNRHPGEALMLFRKLKREKCGHDSITLLSLLQALSQLGHLSLVKEVHSHLYRVNTERETPVINSLITTYAKCGDLEVAKNLFKHMNKKCVTSWNTMIAAYAMHGNSENALNLFEQMKEANIKPNDITFTSLLTSCSHSGMVEEGMRVYKAMIEDHLIIPSEEHFCCMVDLLSRAGRIEEAYDLAKTVSLSERASAFGALAAACRVYGNREIGEVIGREILEMEPERSSAYALVSNLFAEGGKWDEVARLRGLVKKRGLKMTPGYSLIELDKQVSEV